jgi:hypothetical protein
MVTENVVNLNGDPVHPELPFDGGLLDLLERAIAELKRGKMKGLAVVWVSDGETGVVDIDCSWQGPRLSLMAGAQRLAHRINLSLDENVRTDP